MRKNTETIITRQHRTKRRFLTMVLSLAVCVALACPAFASGGGGGDPLTIVNNLSDFSAPVSGR